MKAAALTEVVCGLLVVPPATRRRGARWVAAVSSLVMLSESSKGEMTRAPVLAA